MRYMSLFSGIEAATIAWKPLGWQCVGVAEIDPFPCAVLAHHYPDVPNLGSVTDITDEQIAALGHIDLVVGGSPCQDLSVAGKRSGLAGERSGLFYEQKRIFDAARSLCNARWLLWENVPGAFSSNGGADFAAVVGELAGAGFNVPGDGWKSAGVAVGENGCVEWCVLDAQFFGLAQRRKRVFALLDTGNWADRPPILFDAESMSGDSAPCRQAGENPAPTISARPTGGGGLGTDFDLDGGLVAPTVTGGPPFSRTGNSRVETDALVTHALRGEGFDASEDGTGRGTPLVPWPADIAPTLNAAFGDKQGLEDQHALHGSGLFVPCQQAYSIMPMNSGKDYNATEPRVDMSPCLTGADRHGVSAASGVRRLTPVECERLQGFPDNFTQIPYRNKPADKCPDGPRYKALGNSMATPVMRWLGEQIGRVTCC